MAWEIYSLQSGRVHALWLRMKQLWICLRGFLLELVISQRTVWRLNQFPQNILVSNHTDTHTHVQVEWPSSVYQALTALRVMHKFFPLILELFLTDEETRCPAVRGRGRTWSQIWLVPKFVSLNHCSTLTPTIEVPDYSHSPDVTSMGRPWRNFIPSGMAYIFSKWGNDSCQDDTTLVRVRVQ